MPIPLSPDYAAIARETRCRLTDFRFEDGTQLPELHVNYATWGTPRRDPQGRITNAVLLCHGTAGFWRRFTEAWWAERMFGPGQPLDISRYYVIAPDHLGAGGSSKPSDGLRMAFPRYTHADVVQAHYRLLTEHLQIGHLLAVMGPSYGGRLCWQWAVSYPEFMDGIVPISATPYPLVGRRGMQDFLGTEPLLSDPTWNDGNYREQPRNFPIALMAFWVFVFGNGHLWDVAPTRDRSRTYLPHLVNKLARELDANDWIYQLRVNEHYNLIDQLQRLRARVLIVEMAGDDMVPPELGYPGQLLTRLGDRARAVVVSEGAHYGHAGIAKTMPLYSEPIGRFLRSLASAAPGTEEHGATPALALPRQLT